MATEEKAHSLEEAISLMQFKRKVDSQQVLVSEKVTNSGHKCVTILLSFFIGCHSII